MVEVRDLFDHLNVEVFTFVLFCGRCIGYTTTEEEAIEYINDYCLFPKRLSEHMLPTMKLFKEFRVPSMTVEELRQIDEEENEYIFCPLCANDFTPTGYYHHVRSPIYRKNSEIFRYEQEQICGDLSFDEKLKSLLYFSEFQYKITRRCCNVKENISSIMRNYPRLLPERLKNHE